MTWGDTFMSLSDSVASPVLISMVHGWSAMPYRAWRLSRARVFCSQGRCQIHSTLLNQVQLSPSHAETPASGEASKETRALLLDLYNSAQ